MTSVSRVPVELWRAPLANEPDRLRTRAGCLDADERARAAKFRFARDYSRWVAARGLLRRILATYVGDAPARLRFGYEARGKPFLRDYPDLQFNLSHAADLLVVAVARGRRVGVDVEAAPTEAVIDQISPLVLSVPEKAELRGANGPDRRKRFAQIWTRKEAYIKAEGCGLSLPLDHIDAGPAGERVRVLDQGTAAWNTCFGWTLQPVAVANGYAAAVAVEGCGWMLACGDWPGEA
jgi:4'-phosphopantetheinyl transferase